MIADDDGEELTNDLLSRTNFLKGELSRVQEELRKKSRVYFDMWPENAQLLYERCMFLGGEIQELSQVVMLLAIHMNRVMQEAGDKDPQRAARANYKTEQFLKKTQEESAFIARVIGALKEKHKSFSPKSFLHLRGEFQRCLEEYHSCIPEEKEALYHDCMFTGLKLRREAFRWQAKRGGGSDQADNIAGVLKRLEAAHARFLEKDDECLLREQVAIMAPGL